MQYTSQFKPIIPWMGGKRRLAKHIIPHFPEHQCYVEPFCGGAAIFFMKEQSRVEVINDVNGELINLYRIVQNHLEEFIRQFKWALTSRQVFKWMKMTPIEPLTDIQRAARFYYLQVLAFGGKVDGQTFGTKTTSAPGLNLLRLEESLSNAHFRLSRTTIEHLDWDECVKRYDRANTLFYLDPPYWSTTGYGVDFGLEQYTMMADLAKTIKGKMVVSVNDISEMREIFDGLNIKEVKINYTVGGSKNQKQTQELIISNY